MDAPSPTPADRAAAASFVDSHADRYDPAQFARRRGELIRLTSWAVMQKRMDDERRVHGFSAKKDAA